MTTVLYRAHRLFSSLQVREIRRLHAVERWTQYAIARKYNVTQPAISLIVNHKSYAHVKQERA